MAIFALAAISLDMVSAIVPTKIAQDTIKMKKEPMKMKKKMKKDTTKM